MRLDTGFGARFGEILVLASICAIGASHALADPQQSSNKPVAEGTGFEIKEIVVTARRRAESAQTVPVAVTAVSAAALEEQHITNGQDLQGQVPSLSVSPYGQMRDVEMFVIRGQSTQYGAASAVVQYMAEVPLVQGTITSLQGSPGQFLDLADVQVLRGPQGTLFGRNTTGGAVLLEPARPTDHFTGSLALQGGNYGDKEAQAVVNVPISEKLMVRLAGEWVDRDGYTRDVVTGANYDDRHYWAGRLGVTYKPTGSIENYLTVSGSRSYSSGTGWVLQAFNSPYIDAGIFGTVGGCAGVGLGANCSVLDQFAAAQAARGPRNVSLGPTPPSLGALVEGWNAVDQLKVALSDTLTIRNIFSMSSLNSAGPFDGDGSPLPFYNSNAPLVTGYTDETRQLTEELQIQGTALQNSLNYTAGIYYEAVNTPSTVLLQNQVFFSGTGLGYSFDDTARALYAQIGYDFGHTTDALAGLKLTAGARYTWDSVHALSSAFNIDPAGALTGCSNGVPVVPTGFTDCALGATQKSSAPSWTIGLDYMIENHVLTYGKVTRGYKRGGFNIYAVNQDHLTFAPEYVTTYELGFKSTFNDGAVPFTFNADVFHTDYKDIQISAGDFNAISFASGAAVFNAASATIKGVEVEGSVAPVHGLELSANYSHLQGTYKKFSIDSPFGQMDCSGGFVAGPVDLSCVPFSYLPKDQFSVTARYTLPISRDMGKLVVSATYSYTGAQVETTTQLPQFEPGSLVPSFGLINASINWTGILRSPIDASFFVTNATNKTYEISNTGVFNTIGVESNLYGEPRMYGLRLRYHW